MSERILIVDDDAEIRTLLGKQLNTSGFAVTGAADGQAMRRELKRHAFDLIILDLNLPGEDGLTLCRELTGSCSIPIIMLTARGDPLDRIIGLELGADDYMSKPFEPRELLARAKSVLRRAKALPANLDPLEATRARLSDWTLDFQYRQLTDPNGRVAMLSSTEFRLLRIFVEYANRVLSREQLLTLGATTHEDTNDRAIDLQVSRLRAKFGEEGPALIRTVRNQGYVLAAPVTIE